MDSELPLAYSSIPRTDNNKQAVSLGGTWDECSWVVTRGCATSCTRYVLYVVSPEHVWLLPSTMKTCVVRCVRYIDRDVSDS